MIATAWEETEGAGSKTRYFLVYPRLEESNSVSSACIECWHLLLLEVDPV